MSGWSGFTATTELCRAGSSGRSFSQRGKAFALDTPATSARFRGTISVRIGVWGTASAD